MVSIISYSVVVNTMVGNSMMYPLGVGLDSSRKVATRIIMLMKMKQNLTYIYDGCIGQCSSEGMCTHDSDINVAYGYASQNT